MSKIPIVVSFGSTHDENNQVSHGSLFPMLVDEKCTFESLRTSLYGHIGLDSDFPLKLVFSMDLGLGSNGVIEFKADCDIAWFFAMLKDNSTYPLIVISGVNSSGEAVPSSSTNLSYASETTHGTSDSQLKLSWRGIFYEDNVDQVDISSSSRRIMDFFGADKLHEIEEIKEDSFFASKEQFNTALNILCMKKNFEFRVVKSNHKTLAVQCLGDGCSWFVRASKYKDSDFWCVKKFVSEHSCILGVLHGVHRHATSLTISQCFKQDFINEKVQVMHTGKIVDYMRKNFGVTISYYKAWKSRELGLSALIRSPEESYTLLPYFASALKIKNPGSVTAFEVDNQGRFKYFFMSIVASIEGWIHCRLVISVDGISLKNKYLGMLLIACCLDGNNQIFPLAFAIVDSENTSSYRWFFKNMRNVVGHRPYMVSLSDRHPAIPSAISEAFPLRYMAYVYNIF